MNLEPEAVWRQSERMHAGVQTRGVSADRHDLDDIGDLGGRAHANDGVWRAAAS